MMNPCRTQLCPYNYERIEVVLKIIEAADENMTSFCVSQVKINGNNLNVDVVPQTKSTVPSIPRQWAFFST